MPAMKRNFKDSVFTCLFSDPKYMRELYLYLHPEDSDVTEDEFQLITTENILAAGQYNDLGIQVRGRLILLVEAQSVFSANIVLRMLLYLAATYKEYVVAHELSLYSTKAVSIPVAELYVVYTGTKENVPEVLHLSDLSGRRGSAEVEVAVLRGRDNSVLGQYVAFCQIADEQCKLYGRTKKAIQETMLACHEKGILIPFLTTRRKEVIDIMEMLFSQEEIWEMNRREIAREARQEGLQEGLQEGRQEGRQVGRQEGRQEMTALYGELQRRLDPLGRIGELLSAITDPNKLAALAQEFGLKM